MQADPPPRYQAVAAAKASGSTYTPPALASFVAAQVASRVEGLRDRDRELRLLDPAVGDGELLVQLVSALRERGFERVQVCGYDIDAEALSVAAGRLEAMGVRPSFQQVDFLAVAARSSDAGPLFAQRGGRPFDVILANPPYVRPQILGGELARRLAHRHGLNGRVDLYQAFMVTLGDWLGPHGVAGLITSNRFLTVKAGESVRQHLWSTFRVHHVWDLGDTKCFEAAVLPAVTLLEKPDREPWSQGEVRMTSIYETSTLETSTSAGSVFEALALEGVVAVDERTFEVRQGRVQTERGGRAVWRLGNAEVDGWLERVARRTWKTFGQVGKNRVGIKTTADAVFIRDDWETLEGGEPELLRPLTTHHIGRRYRAHATRKSVLYPHEVEAGKRRAVDLEAHPRAKAYLELHRERLAGRKYVAKARRAWFEIWVPQDPSDWSRPKLVFRDITDQPQFWMDLSGSVVNGDCYWMRLDREHDDLLWLALAVGNSSFACAFYDRRFNNKLYAGRRRFIT